ncbi:MAG: hypothetical protein ACKVP7_00895 [Hyphomicrobiaceae bacterium]
MPVTVDWMRRLSWQALAVAFVAGGIVHIVATLVIPQFARASAFQRISAGLPFNVLRVLPPASPELTVLPFLAADERIAVCRFNVASGPVDIAAVLPDKGWTLGLYTASGDNFYVVPAQDLRRFELVLTLVPAQDRYFGFLNMGRQADTSASQISVPSNEGFMIVRGTVRSRSHAAETEYALHQARCAPRQP